MIRIKSSSVSKTSLNFTLMGMHQSIYIYIYSQLHDKNKVVFGFENLPQLDVDEARVEQNVDRDLVLDRCRGVADDARFGGKLCCVRQAGMAVRAVIHHRELSPRDENINELLNYQLF